MHLQEFKNVMAMKACGMRLDEAIKRGICIACHEEALPNCYSEAGRKEYLISGLCERCFDRLFRENLK